MLVNRARFIYTDGDKLKGLGHHETPITVHQQLQCIDVSGGVKNETVLPKDILLVGVLMTVTESNRLTYHFKISRRCSVDHWSY